MKDYRTLNNLYDLALKHAEPGHDFLLLSEAGSRMWGMGRPDSDHDVFVVYAEDTDKVLDGRASYKSYDVQGVEFGDTTVDFSFHECKKVVEQLLKGNVNYVQGVLSPQYVASHHSGHSLKALTNVELSKNLFNSVRGMAVSNFKDLKDGRYKAEKLQGADYLKKVNQVARLLQFGTNVLNGHPAEFKPTYLEDLNGLQGLFDELDTAYQSSNLAEKPEEVYFRNWLYNVRVELGQL